MKAQLIKTIESPRLILCSNVEATLIDYQSKENTQSYNGFHIAHIDFDSRFTTVVCTQVFKNLKQKVILSEKFEFGYRMIDFILLQQFMDKHSSDFARWEREIPNFNLNLQQKIDQMKAEYNENYFKHTFVKVLIGDRPTVVLFFTADQAKLAINKYMESIKRRLDDCSERIAIGTEDESLAIFLQGDVLNCNNLKILDLLPSNSKLILAQDAVLNGLAHLGQNQNLIQSRVCRYSYGTQYSKLFDPKTDDPNQFKWGIAPNQYVAAYLPFTTAGKQIPPHQVFEQLGTFH